jgi:ABC-type phosphate transport system substrate-binding protein
VRNPRHRFPVGATPSSAREPEFRLIVNPDVQGGQVPREALSSIFLRKSLRWANGAPIQPVDQSLRSPVRAAFSLDVHQLSIVEIQILWQRRMASGLVPPPVKASDAEVVAFVAETSGSIGYVSRGAVVPPTARTLAVSD